MTKALLLVSHGSRAARANEENRVLAELLQQKSGASVVEYAFLEAAEPSVMEGIESCVRRGASEITILLNFLNSGRHVTEDLPALADEARRRFPELKIVMTPPIGQHPKLPDLFLELLEND